MDEPWSALRTLLLKKGTVAVATGRPDSPTEQVTLYKEPFDEILSSMITPIASSPSGCLA
jgi:hypothetical protein